MSDFLEVFYKRRSVRKFTEEPVSRKDFVTLLKAGMSGPSGMNAQPWEFVVITEKETMDKFRRGLMFAKMNAPAAICVLGSSRMQTHRSGDKFWVQDCSAATENILLAATAMGLGTVWIGVHPVFLFEKQVKSILNLPKGVTPLNLIMLGHPAEEKEPRTQYDEKRVHWGPF
jgi:nitroreductase